MTDIQTSARESLGDFWTHSG